MSGLICQSELHLDSSINPPDSPIEDEYLLLAPRVGDSHVGHHDAVDVRGRPVKLNAHLQGGAGTNRQLVVDQVV